MITALLTAGLLVGGSGYPPAPPTTDASVVNPRNDECVAVSIDTERTAPTPMAPDPEPLSITVTLKCGAEGGDDLFIWRIDADTADVVAELVQD